MRKWIAVLNIYPKEIVALLIGIVIGISSHFVFDDIPVWVHPVVGFAAFFIALELQNLFVSLWERITCKCLKVLKLNRWDGCFSIRKTYLKDYRNFSCYMDKFMDDVFRMIWYAKKKMRTVVEAEVNEKQVKAILYCISDDAKEVVQKMNRLEKEDVIRTEAFELKKEEERLDRTVRYMYHIIPRKRELSDILSVQRMYHIRIDISKVEIGEEKTGMLAKIRKLIGDIYITKNSPEKMAN